MKKQSPSTARTPRRTVEPVADPEPIVSTPTEPEGSRVSFAVGPDGKPINPDRLRSNTRDALRVAYADEAFLKAIGVKSDDDAESDALMSIVSAAALDITSVLMLLGARRAGYSVEHAKILAFTPQEKAQLNAPVARVVRKYLPDIGGKYRDEIMLAIALTNVIGQKIILLRETVAAERTRTGSTVAPAPQQQPQPENAA